MPIGNATEAERATLIICAEWNGACHCASVWGFPKDCYPACARLLERAREAWAAAKAEAEAGP